MKSPDINSVKEFWNNNPLWTGESRFAPGSKEFFAEHRSVSLKDCFGGRMDERVFPVTNRDQPVLDLGCGIGFWLKELSDRGFTRIHGADLTPASLKLARQRCELFNVACEFHEENAECLSFKDGSFAHVNCQGVIHHTPHPDRAIAEIARVLQPQGTASISVYYKNVIIRNWRIFSQPSKLLGRLGAKLSGRGREQIYSAESVDEIIRLYDGKDNPIGIGYSCEEFRNALSPHFHVEAIYFHFFPRRSLPFYIPPFVHRWLDRQVPFMIYGQLRKR